MSASDPSTARFQPRDDGEAIRLGPDRAARRLVLLHGWGADADDLVDLGMALLQQAAAAGIDPAEVSLVALRAPLPHPAGYGRQWYDLQLPEWPELPQALHELRHRLEALATSVPLAHTALLGFSQGAAMALDVATGGGSASPAQALPLAALIACSGYPHPDWQPMLPLAPVLLTHGEQDPVVPFAASEELERQLRLRGGVVRRIAFAGGHGIDPDLIPALAAFLCEGWRRAAGTDQAPAGDPPSAV
jgi:phospholipase/carboxylesterase